MNVYLIFKAIHLLAVVAFLGNIVTGLFWMRFSVRTNNPIVIRHTVAGIIASDRYFTIPGVLIITAAGFGAALYGGIPLLKTGWIFWPILLFSLSGVFFAAKVAPLQSKMKQQLDIAIREDQFQKDQFSTVLNQWEFWGFMALVTPLASFFMMILKWPAKSPLAW